MAKAGPVPVKKGIFFGWYIVAAAFVMQFLNGGIIFYGFSAFFTPLIAEFQWSRAALSGAFSFSRLEQGIMAPVVGFLVDRYGPRRLILFGIVVVALGFFLISRIESLFAFYVVFFVVAIGTSFAFVSPTLAAVANWFSRRRTLAMGITMCGAGAGGVAIVGLSWLITQYGWRTSTVVVAIVFLVVGLPLALVFRHKPEQYGYLPDGDTPTPASSTASGPADEGSEVAGGQEEGEVNFTPRQALASSTFWIFSIVLGLRAIITAGVAVHEIPALIDAGFAPELAASALGLMTIISIPGRLGFGWMFDRYDKRHGIALCLALQCVGLVIFANATEFWHVLLFLAVFSPAYGGMIPLTFSFWGLYFGRKYFASISGLGQVPQMVGNIAGPILAGYLFDVSGSYQLAFILFAIANIPGVFLIFLCRRTKPKVAVAAA